MACTDFQPLNSVYKPIGLLYRPMAANLCVCGRPKTEHADSLPRLAARNIAATKDSSLVDELTKLLQEETGG